MNTEATAATTAEAEAEAGAATEDEVVLTEEEAFDAAFDEATTVLSDDTDAGDTNDGGATDAEGTATNDTGDSESGTTGTTDGTGSGDTDDSAGATGSDDTTGDGGSAGAAEVTADSPTAREVALQAQIDELKAAAVVAPAADTKPVVEPEPVAETPQPTLTAEETAKVTAYREEWGDVSEAEALIRKEENQVIVGYIFNQMKDVLAPLLAAHETRNGRDQYTDLVALVPDYDTVRDKAVDWVDKMPEGVNKKIYTEVTKTGTPDEVAEMINAYKKATGYETSAASTAETKPAGTGAEAAVQKPAGAGAAAKPAGKAAAALKVVKTVRSKTNTGGVDVNDFDTAFDEFAQKK